MANSPSSTDAELESGTVSQTEEPPTDSQERTSVRPPGEIGGHTVQPSEQDPVPPTTTPNSKDVPPPSQGTPEARSKGPGPSPKTTSAPGNQPTGASPGHGRSIAQETAAPGTAQLPGSEGTDPGEKGGPPALNRPPRPPVYKPQTGHEPAPRPPPAQATQAKSQGFGTEGDRLVEAITKALADNLAKAFHQSVAQAVRESMPLSERTVDVGPKLAPAARKAKPSEPAGPKPPSKAGAVKKDPEPAPRNEPVGAPDPSAPSQYGDKPRPSQYGGTIEAPDEQAKAKLAAAGTPGSPALGQAAQESADAQKREGKLT